MRNKSSKAIFLHKFCQKVTYCITRLTNTGVNRKSLNKDKLFILMFLRKCGKNFEDVSECYFLFIHSFIPAISIAPLQVLYYSEALPTTARTLFRSFTPKRTG